MTRAIHQFVAGFSRADAISNEAFVLRNIFRSWGYKSEIFCEPRRILPELRKEALSVNSCRENCAPNDIVLLHLSIGSDVNEIFAQLPCRKAILYHNITPPEYLAGIQQQIAANLQRGRDQLTKLSGVAEVVMADSEYNAKELEQLGYGKVSVLPLVLDLAKLRATPHRGTVRNYNDGLTNIIFVGRCVPNKRLEDLLCAFHYFQTSVEPQSRFIHAGSYAGTEHYHALLLTMVREFGSQNVEFIGSAPQQMLNAVFQTAHVFLCMSEHEGFCIPLIESMVHDLPVLAYQAGAVPETLDGAGILFREKKYPEIAEMMGQLVKNNELRQAVIAKQRQRLARYEQRNLAEELRAHLETLLA